MRVKVFTDTSKTVVEGIYIADADYANEHYAGRWEEDVVTEPPTEAPPWEWFIDHGPFYDRFGAAKTAVLTSSDVGVRAILEDVKIRKWIDLKRVDVAQSLAYIGSVVSAVTPELQASVLTTPVAAEENLALRKLYFS